MGAESQIEKALVKYAKANGIYTRKFTSPSHAGVPDRIFCFSGVTLFLEIKAPGNRPTPLQTDEIEILSKHGMAATWCDTLTSGKEFLDSLKGDSFSQLLMECWEQNARLAA